MCDVPIFYATSEGQTRRIAERIAQQVRKHGLDSSLTEGRDGHNYTGWRDLLDPVLGDLLARVWGIGLGG
jgi:menaquinone-dependent protoporphyrinogen IX oxidase